MTSLRFAAAAAFAGGILALFVLARLPEPRATLLTEAQGWQLTGPASSRLPLTAFPERSRQVRRSAVESPGGVIFRTWIPEKGIVPVQATSAPFQPQRYMSVLITGTDRTAQGRVRAVIECETNGKALEVFRGGVNVDAAEAIVAAPVDWCPGSARLKFASSEEHNYAGAGAVFALSPLSYAKASFVGRLPFMVTALTVFIAVLLSGGTVARRLGWSGDSLFAGLVALGTASLGAFYLASALPQALRWLTFPAMAAGVLFGLSIGGWSLFAKTWRDLFPYVLVWLIATMAFLSLQGLVVNGIGHWEPNYRFWPAIWSTDNELPWWLAEAIRRGDDIARLYARWRPTDRPPLTTGADLLLFDSFAWLQAANDGNHLRGQAYNAAALALNALWVPVCFWMLAALRAGRHAWDRVAVVAFVGCLPFVIFNTQYGWPKAFGAAYALMAFVFAWRVCSAGPHEAQPSSAPFFVLAAFSMLAHASTATFLLPVAAWVAWKTWRRNPAGLLAGASLAFGLMATWSVYKALVLPSDDPLITYALTGSFGFGEHGLHIWDRIARVYGGLDVTSWLGIKAIALAQSFVPVNHGISKFFLNGDSGAGTIDRLRAWDMMLLSKGNLAVPLLGIVAACDVLIGRCRKNAATGVTDAPFAALLAVCAAAWLLMVLLFLAPVVIPHWAQAALLGAALAGAVVVQRRHPRWFTVVFVATAAYSAVVWGLSPIEAGLDLDAGAAVVLALVVASTVLARRWIVAALDAAGPAPLATGTVVP